MALPIFCHNRGSSFVREVFNTLLRAEVELHPGALVLGIDHREGVTSEQMHMPERLWNSAVGHDNCDLMQRLRQKSPEVPVILGAPKPGARVTFDSVVEVREAQRIAEEKHRGIVSDDVPISVLGVKLERCPADIALRIGRAAFPGDGRKARKHGRLLSNLRKYRRFRVL